MIYEHANPAVPRPVADQLTYELPGIRRHGYVQVTPRDPSGRRCAAWDAAYYIATGTPLDELEAALRARPGTARTTQVTAGGQARDADWPGFARRRDRRGLRPQVLAMVADPY